MRWRRTLAALALPLLLAAFGDLEDGNRHYRAGRYAEAVEAYRRAIEAGEADPYLHYNLGTALLQLQRYEEAEREFRLALGAVEPELREATYYNLGGRFLYAARASDDAEAGARLLDAAVETYRHALRLAPSDSAAKWNYELALREREEQQKDPQQSGGGAEQQDQGEDQQSGGGGGAQSPANPNPGQGGAQGDSEPAPAMSREDAERLLAAIEQDERELYREALRKGRRDQRGTRNW